MLSFRSPLKTRNGAAELRPGSKQADGAWRGAADWEAKENAGCAGPALLTTRGCAPPDEAPGGGGNHSAAALVRALVGAVLGGPGPEGLARVPAGGGGLRGAGGGVGGGLFDQVQ